MTASPFNVRQDPHRPGSAWRNLLDRARSEGEVVARVREFIASFTPYEIDALPEALRPGKVVDGDDVASLALEYRRADTGALLVSLFADVFSHAAVRLTQLAAQPGDVDLESA